MNVLSYCLSLPHTVGLLSARLALHHSLFVSYFLSCVCRKALYCALERNSPKTGSLSCRCWKDILTLFDFWCRLMTSGKRTLSPPRSIFFSLFLTFLLSTLDWPLSLCDWQEILTYRKLTEHDKSPIITTMWLCVHSTVQGILMLSIHTCTHIHIKSLHLLSSSALHCGSMLHTGMVEWVCISGQIGI